MNPFDYIFTCIGTFFLEVFKLFKNVQFSLLGFEVNLLYIILSFLVLGLIVNQFWRGVN